MAENLQTTEVDIKPPGRFSSAFANLSAAVRAQLRSRLLRNIFTVVSGTAGAQALTMLFMPVITRLYGPESYGVLGVFMGIVMMIVPVAALTYPMAIVLPKRDADARAIVRLSLMIAVGVAAVFATVLYFFSGPILSTMGVEEIAPFVMLLPVVMLFGAGLESAQQWLIRKQLFSVTARVAVLHSLLHNSIRSAGGLIMASPAMLVITTAFGPLLHATMLLLGIRGRNARMQPEQDRRKEVRIHPLEPAREYRDFPLFRAPSIFINTMSQNLPTLVLAAYFGPAAAGFFALCKQALSMPTHLIGKSVADVYYPKLTQAIQRTEPVTLMLLKAIAGLAVVGIVPFGTIFLFGPWIFSFVFGSEWETAGQFARWLALAEYAIFISRPCTVAFPALSLQRVSLAFELVSTSLRITALFIGATLMQEALSTVVAFSMASIVIYASLILLVLYMSRLRYAQGYRKRNE